MEQSDIKAVIFDVGGVLLRTEDQTSRQKLADQYGITLEELSRVVFLSDVSDKSTVGELEEEEVWNHVAEHFGLNEQEKDAFKAAFWEGDQLDRQLLEYIRSLRGRYQIGLLSNAWSGARAALGGKYQFLDAFDTIIFSSEVGLAKPDAAIYHLILEQLGVKPQEAVFVDDFRANVEAARETGLHAIHFKSREQALGELENLLGADGNQGARQGRE